MLSEVLLVGAGGFAGSAGRYLISVAALSAGWHFCIGTFVVNFVGSLLIGMLVNASHNWHHLLALGFCGGFTTFSTFSLENLGLIKSGKYAESGLYIILSVLTCLLAVWLGSMIVSKIK